MNFSLIFPNDDTEKKETVHPTPELKLTINTAIAEDTWVTVKGGSWLGGVDYPSSASHQLPVNNNKNSSKTLQGPRKSLLLEDTLVPKFHYRIPVRWPIPHRRTQFPK